jgi:alpha-D-xyloside xylohydrolase
MSGRAASTSYRSRLARFNGEHTNMKASTVSSFSRLRLLGLLFCLIPSSGSAQANRLDARELTVQAACGTLRLDAIATNAIRVRCGGIESPSALPELIYTQIEPVSVTVGSNKRSQWIRSGKIKAIVDKRTTTIRFLDARGHLLTEETPAGRRWMESDKGQRSEGVAEVSYRLQPDEHLYGSGQFQDGYLDIARLPRSLVQLNTQIAIPFFISSKGYGVLWHQYGMTELNPPTANLNLLPTASGQSESVDVTTSAGTQRQQRQGKQFEATFQVPQTGEYALQLDSGRTMTDRYNLTIDGTSIIDLTNLWLPGSTSTITHLRAGSHHVAVQANADDHPSLRWGLTKNQTTLRSPNAPRIDYTVFAGTADEVIASYRKLSGEAPLFPKWAFGFIQCRERYHSSKEILDTIQQFRKDRLPLDLIVQDWQYWGKYGWNAMRFDKRYYPDPELLVQQVHQQHAHLMVSVWSRFDPASEVGKAFQEHNYFIPGTTWVDFLNPSAAQLYWKEFSTRLRTLGIDAWWLDATEPENDDLHGRVTAAGPGDEYRLAYPLFVTKTVYEGSRRDAPNQRTMILTRSAFSGEQRHGVATWSGDVGNGWDTLKRQVTAGLGYMASGMPYWTTDTGGFFRPGTAQYTDPAYQERFLRWMEFSVFTPLLRVHGYQTNTEPWNYGPEMVDRERQLLDLRYQLLPYIYSQAASVTFEGGTMMRPLVMDFPNDEKALDQKYEYMFGPAFLVAPVLGPGIITTQVYAPKVKGGWYEWWTGKWLPGGGETTLVAPVGRIPVLVRAGSIVPIAPVQQYVGQDQNPVLELRVYPGADGNITLYDDDGTTYGYEQNQRSIINVSWDEQLKRLTIATRKGTYPGMPPKRQFHVRCMRTGKSNDREIYYDGEQLQIKF